MITIEEIHSFNQAAHLKHEWDALVQEAGLNLSLRFDFVMSLWEAHLDKKNIVLLLAKEDGKTVGIFPFFFTYLRIFGILPVVQLDLLTNIFSLYNDFICVDRADRLIFMVIDHMRKYHKQWQVLHIGNVLESSMTDTLFRNNQTLMTVRYLSGVSPFINLENGIEEYLKSKSRNFRQNLRRKECTLNEFETICMKMFDKDKDIDNALDRIYEIERESWKKGEGISIEQNEKQKRFYEIYLNKAAVCGMVKIYFLCINGEYAAFKLYLCDKDSVYFTKTAYKAKYKKYSLGFLLQAFTIKKFMELHKKECDLLIGETRLKLEFATGSKKVFNIYVYNECVYARVLFCIKKTIIAVKKVVGHPKRSTRAETHESKTTR
jgi:CelD/BcsL family acetyltransferase involved in cellulose biosynthesis